MYRVKCQVCDTVSEVKIKKSAFYHKPHCCVACGSPLIKIDKRVKA